MGQETITCTARASLLTTNDTPEWYSHMNREGRKGISHRKSSQQKDGNDHWCRKGSLVVGVVYDNVRNKRKQVSSEVVKEQMSGKERASAYAL